MAGAPRYRVEGLGGIVHVAYGMLEADVKRGFSPPKPDRIIFVCFACDDVAIGRHAAPEKVSEDRNVTCLGCIAETRHGTAERVS